MPPSIRRRLVVAAALLALAAPALAAATRDPADPRAPVAALYAIEKTGQAPLATPAQRAAALTRGLAAMWDKAEAGARRGGGVAIDFDVVTNSQGAEVKSYALAVSRARREPRDRRRDDRPRRLGARVAARKRHHVLAVAPERALARRRRQRRRRAQRVVAARHARPRAQGALRARGRCAAWPLLLAALIALAAPALAAGPLDELRRSFTLGGKPVPPDVFRDFGDADLGDSLPSVVAIDVKAAIDSNRYGDPIVRRGDWVTQSRPAAGSLNGAEETSYRYIGATKSGLLVVIATYSGGGSGVFTTLHVLDASLAAGFDGDGKRYGRVDLAVLRSVVLGDRWEGEATIVGDAVRIATAKTPAEGFPSRSRRSGRSATRKRDRRSRLQVSGLSEHRDLPERRAILRRRRQRDPERLAGGAIARGQCRRADDASLARALRAGEDFRADQQAGEIFGERRAPAVHGTGRACGS